MREGIIYDCPHYGLCGTASFVGKCSEECFKRYNAEMGNKKPMTNADRIRAMSDEELANMVKCPHVNNWDRCKNDCFVCCLEWLQMPAEGD